MVFASTVQGTQAHRGGKDCLPCSQASGGFLCPTWSSHWTAGAIGSPAVPAGEAEPCCSSPQPTQPRPAVHRLVSRQGHRVQGTGRAVPAGDCREQEAFSSRQPEPPAHLNIFTKGATLLITRDFGCKDDYCSLSAKINQFSWKPSLLEISVQRWELFTPDHSTF